MTHFDQENLNPTELLETLHGYPFLAGFSLEMMSPDGHLLAFRGNKLKLCDTIASNTLCGINCRAEMERVSASAQTLNRPQVMRCPIGFLKAIIPLQVDRSNNLGYLICSGKREKIVDLENIRPLANKSAESRKKLVSEWESLPTVSISEIENVASKTHQLITSLLGPNFSTFALHKNLNRLRSIAGITAEIDQIENAGSLTDILNETLSILFDIPEIIYILPSEFQADLFEITTPGRPTINRLSLTALHRRQNWQALLLDIEKDREAFSFLGNVRHAYSIPMALEGESLGHIFLCDTDLYSHDMTLIDLLIGRVAAKLLHIKRKKDFLREKTLSSRLLSDVAQLSRCRSRCELYQNLLELSAKLLGATKGSVMLCDDNRKNLWIEVALGMNPQLSQRLKVQVGGSFAGRVLAEGTPLLVENIEMQSDLSFNSRPRFKTKSFLSFPLKDDETTVGVLNLSDKTNGDLFTESDLELLTALTISFSGLLRGVTAQEKVGHLEELSMTDPLTGLHNRRFLQHRMEEELSRSTRQELNLAVMMIDLDYFKKYNDLCGHLAGDKALEKLAGILKSSSRTMDVVTRFGGEEFCIILPGASKTDTELVAQRIQDAIAREPFAAEELLPMGRLTASIGIAFFPRDGKTALALINAADTALYAAKAAGRNKIRVFKPDLEKELPPDNDRPEENPSERLTGFHIK